MADDHDQDDERWPPRIDLRPFLSPPSSDDAATAAAKKHAAARALRRACQRDGLFLVPFPPALRASAPRALAAVNALFALDSAAKQRGMPLVSRDGFIRGYLPVFGESGLKGAYREWKEGFSFGYPWEELGSEKQPQPAPTNPLQGPNVWPAPGLLGEAEAAAWRGALNALFADLVSVAEALGRALSLALGREEGFLAREVCDGGETISLVRAFHYLPVAGLGGLGKEGEGTAAAAAIGSSPHTDWGFLTLIVQDGVGGLQVRRRGEEEGWVDVPAVEDCLVVNCGDFLSLLSAQLLREQPLAPEPEPEQERQQERQQAPDGDADAAAAAAEPGREQERQQEWQRPFHSPVHRVTLSEQERTSLVFFYYPSFDTPLPSAPAPAAAPSSSHQPRKGETSSNGEAYNTLLDAKAAGAGAGGITFGQHLMRKWAGVSS